MDSNKIRWTLSLTPMVSIVIVLTALMFTLLTSSGEYGHGVLQILELYFSARTEKTRGMLETLFILLSLIGLMAPIEVIHGSSYMTGLVMISFLSTFAVPRLRQVNDNESNWSAKCCFSHLHYFFMGALATTAAMLVVLHRHSFPVFIYALFALACIASTTVSNGVHNILEDPTAWSSIVPIILGTLSLLAGFLVAASVRFPTHFKVLRVIRPHVQTILCALLVIMSMTYWVATPFQYSERDILKSDREFEFWWHSGWLLMGILAPLILNAPLLARGCPIPRDFVQPQKKSI